MSEALAPSHQAYFERYLKTLPPEHPHHQCRPSAEYFCADEASANACAELIRQGIKTATCSLLEWYQNGEKRPEIGELMIVLNWEQLPCAIIETTELSEARFCDIGPEWAAAEGEGDRSLAYWQRVHREFFQQDAEHLSRGFSEEAPLLLERFRCVHWEGAQPDQLGEVAAVARSAEHSFSKTCLEQIDCVAGEGVVGDAHRGQTVKHRSRVKQDPHQPNLRQVHLIHEELLRELQQQGFEVAPGALGENITTRGVDILNWPQGTRVHLGEVVLQITGLRNPCAQLNDFQAGLLEQVLERDATGRTIRKSGVMSVVLKGGRIQTGDSLQAYLPPEPHRSLERV